MSGPLTTEDATPAAQRARGADGPVVEVMAGRMAQVGVMTVQRVLPQRPRRTVGAWCFADHVGPIAVREPDTAGIGPHPHMGLQTVTWLLEGELLHLDSLGSEQLIRPGQLNLMTAGHGVAHAEEDPGRSNRLHGIQLWVAQPEATRDGQAAFEHHAVLPQMEVDGASAIILVGDFAGSVSPARRDTEHVGVEVTLRGAAATVPLRRDYEYALTVLEGRVSVEGTVAEPGLLAYLGIGRDELRIQTDDTVRVLLLGGLPFPEPVLMWWNFVARTRDEVSEARRQWSAGDSRFGTVHSKLRRIEVGPPPWE
jgi:redox-sensitive bicupin YhaK (pirin superfamily)